MENSKKNTDSLLDKINEAKKLLSKRKTSTAKNISNILKERAREIALMEEEKKDLGPQLSVIEFSLGKENYAFETQMLSEVVDAETIYDLPGVPDYVFGVINLRGYIVTIINLKKYLSLDYVGFSDEASVIIVKSGDLSVGFVADKIIGIRDIPLNQIQKKKPKLQKIKEIFLKGISNDTLIILDVKKLLEDKSIIVDDSYI